MKFHFNVNNAIKMTHTADNQNDTARSQILAEAAQAYRDNHHWVPLRLKGKSPDCMGAGWTQRTLENACPAFSDGDNIGVLLGAPSGDLVRLDPDFPSIPAVRDILFPEPTTTFGRASSSHSGCLFICKGLASKDFELPPSMKNDQRLPPHDGKPGLKVFQILSTGKQTVVPPSVHPETGEEIVWQQSTAPPVAIEASELLWRCGVEAFLLAVRQFWPPRNTRNTTAMALARVLLEGLEARYADDAKRIAAVDALVVATAMAGGDGAASRNGKKRAKATLQKMRAGKETIGLTRLVELLGLPADVLKTFREWLGIAIKAPVIPVDLWGSFVAPALPTGLLPPAIERYAIAQSEMMGCDASGLAMSALAVCAAAITDRIELQVKRHDRSWKEPARLWVALIGDPSTKKTPIMNEAARPLVHLDNALYREYAHAVAQYEALPAQEKKTAPRPKQKRLRLEDTTIEAAQVVLEDSPDGVLCLQDELERFPFKSTIS